MSDYPTLIVKSIELDGPFVQFLQTTWNPESPQTVKIQYSFKDEDKDKDEERGNDDTAVSEVVNIVVTLRHADDTVTLQTNLKITSRPNHILRLSEALFTILGVLFHYILQHIVVYNV